MHAIHAAFAERVCDMVGNKLAYSVCQAGGNGLLDMRGGNSYHDRCGGGGPIVVHAAVTGAFAGHRAFQRGPGHGGVVDQLLRRLHCLAQGEFGIELIGRARKERVREVPVIGIVASGMTVEVRGARVIQYGVDDDICQVIVRPVEEDQVIGGRLVGSADICDTNAVAERIPGLQSLGRVRHAGGDDYLRQLQVRLQHPGGDARYGYRRLH